MLWRIKTDDQPNRAGRFGKFDGIANQVEQNLLEAGRVTFDGIGQGRNGLGMKPQPPGLGHGHAKGVNVGQKIR